MDTHVSRRGVLRAGGASALALPLTGRLPARAAAGTGGQGERTEDGDADVRVFAVSYRHSVARAESLAAYRASLRRLFEEEVAPALAADRPNLVCLPEAVGLMASFVGERGAAGRELLAEGADPTAAVASLGGPYAPQIAYYQAMYPGATSAGRYLLLALTDTVVRAVVEPAAALAAEYNCYVTTCAWLPAAYERVEGPTADFLAPGRDTDYAYEATSGEVLNRNLVFGPDGERLDAQSKAYLVPLERKQEDGLGVLGIGLDELPVLATPFGRVGTVISKDAWMPDVNDRLEQLGADLLLQPEAFGGWGAPGEDLWLPDKFQRGGWWMLQKHPGLAYNVTSQLTGNFGSKVFDGQPFVAGTAPEGGASCLLGQPPEPGWLAVGRWNSLDGDPGDWCGTDDRRAYAAVGRAMEPGSGDALENAYAEDVVHADLHVGTAGPGSGGDADGSRGDADGSGGDADGPPVARGGFVSSVPVDPSTDAAGFVPALAATPDGAACAWVDFRRGVDHVVYAASTEDGTAWSRPAAVTDREPREFDQQSNQWAPTLAHDDGLVALFGDFRTENWDVYRSRAADGREWGPNERVDDAGGGSGTLRERGHSDPALVATDDALVAAWSDLRWPFVKPQIRVARSTDGGATWSDTVRADGEPTDAEVVQPWARQPTESRGQAHPAVTVHDGDLLVAWQGLTDDGPGVFVSRSRDGGQSFADPVRLDDGGGGRPALGGDGDATWLVWETDRDGGRVLRARRLTPGGAWTTPRPVADPPVDGVRQRYATVAGDRVVFEDDRTGTAAVLVASLRGGRVARVDDAGGAEARAPAATELPDGRLLVAWQDTRDGERVRTATERTTGAALDGAPSMTEVTR